MGSYNLITASLLHARSLNSESNQARCMVIKSNNVFRQMLLNGSGDVVPADQCLGQPFIDDELTRCLPCR